MSTVQKFLQKEKLGKISRGEEPEISVMHGRMKVSATKEALVCFHIPRYLMITKKSKEKTA